MPSSLQPGCEVLGKYRVEAAVRKDREDQHFELYAATHLILNRSVWLCLAHPTFARLAELQQRWLQSMQQLVGVRDPLLLDVYDAFEVEGRAAIATEPPEGQRLSCAMDSSGRRPWSARQLQSWLAPALLAVHALHQRGLSHGRLVPQSFARLGEHQVKLVDLPYLRLSSPRLTLPTPPSLLELDHVAPEWIAAPNEVGPSSDIYSIACIAYRLLTARRVFDTPDAYHTLLAQLSERPTPPSALNPTIHDGLERIILRGLSKDPRFRFESAEVMAEALLSYEHFRLPIPINVPEWSKALSAPPQRSENASADSLEDSRNTLATHAFRREQSSDAKALAAQLGADSPRLDEPAPSNEVTEARKPSTQLQAAELTQGSGAERSNVAEREPPNVVRETESASAEATARQPSESAESGVTPSPLPSAAPPESDPTAQRAPVDEPEAPSSEAQVQGAAMHGDEVGNGVRPSAEPVALQSNRPPPFAAGQATPLKLGTRWQQLVQLWQNMGRSRWVIVALLMGFMASLAGFLSLSQNRLDDASLELRHQPDAVAAQLAQLGAPEGMVLIPEGPAILGADLRSGRWEPNQLPQHLQDLPAFAIDRHEVSAAEFFALLQRHPLPKSRQWATSASDGALPMVDVSWTEAQHYCSSLGKRLPTEAEWEKAARGLSQREFPWTEPYRCGLAQLIWQGCEAPAGPVPAEHAVELSPYGVANLGGNVWEWVGDVYEEGLTLEELQARQLPENGKGRVIKGGDWQSAARTVAWRSWNDEQVRSSIGGFRCALSLAPAQSGFDARVLGLPRQANHRLDAFLATGR
ncbi:MAG: SUMF1/EgtB/PvdO family nonheme iron enzyme [Myxococcota bacterium]|jgi:iron(II)-dependent oxidoreductase|nr:SUMF1/EgtB/PvdO family nonheme iron enzyme [Myxococcota bacterium]